MVRVVGFYLSAQRGVGDDLHVTQAGLADCQKSTTCLRHLTKHLPDSSDSPFISFLLSFLFLFSHPLPPPPPPPPPPFLFLLARSPLPTFYILPLYLSPFNRTDNAGMNFSSPQPTCTRGHRGGVEDRCREFFFSLGVGRWDGE